MVTALCGFVLLMALLSAFVFGGDMVLSLLAAVAALLIGGFALLLGRKQRWASVLAAVLSVALLAFCFYIPSRATDYGYYNYLEKTNGYLSALMNGQQTEAEALRAELDERYGDSDYARFLAAFTALSLEELDQAEQLLNSFADKQTMNYYLLREELIFRRGYETEEAKRQLLSLYLDAAASNPGWVYALEHAGGLLFDQGRYAEAAYYITNAIVLADEPDARTLYILGASLMEQGEFKKGLYYFQLSVDAGAGKDIVRSIAQYAQKAGIEVKYS